MDYNCTIFQSNKINKYTWNEINIRYVSDYTTANKWATFRIRGVWIQTQMLRMGAAETARMAAGKKIAHEMFTRQFSGECNEIRTETTAQVKQVVRRLGLRQQISDCNMNGAERDIHSRQECA
jgi:hypothetical protein